MKKNLFIISFLLLYTLVHSQTRDPWLWPFDQESIWNMPIHTNANYKDANMVAADNVGFDVQYFLKLDSSDPLRDVHANNGWTDRCTSKGDQGYDLHIPDGFIVHPDYDSPYGLTPNSGFAFLKPDSEYMIQGQVLARCDPYGPIYYPGWLQPNKVVSVYGDGLNPKGAVGHGASHMNALGGALREGELTNSEPIRHALTLTIWCKPYAYWDPDEPTPGYQWPATAADGHADKELYGGSDPDFEMGTLLAIPSTVDKGSLGLETTAGSKLFDALRDYGAYVVENAGWDCHYFCAEEEVVLNDMGGAENHVVTSGAFFRDVNKLFEEFHIVTNNSPDSIGGGPTTDHANRLAPMACEMGTIGSEKKCDVKPTVRLTAPADSAIFESGNEVTIEADAYKEIAGVDTVLFYVNDSLIGFDMEAPYSYTWPSPADGKYTLHAVAVDSATERGTSGTRTIWVGNRPPVIKVLNPSPDSTYFENEEMVFRATASDYDGAISKVRFYLADTLAGEIASAPYTFSWMPPGVGGYCFYALAVDIGLDTAFSDTIVFHVRKDYAIGEQQVPNHDFETEQLEWLYRWGEDKGSFEIVEHKGEGMLKLVSNIQNPENYWGIGIANRFDRYVSDELMYELEFNALADEFRFFNFDMIVSGVKVLDEQIQLSGKEQNFRYTVRPEVSGRFRLQFMPGISTIPVYFNEVSFIKGVTPHATIQCSDSLPLNDTLTIEASVYDDDGTIISAELFINDLPVKTFTTSSYSHGYIPDGNLQPGDSITLELVVEDNHALTRSANKTVSVVDSVTNAIYLPEQVARQVRVYPNPAGDYFFIQNNTFHKITQVVVMDATGRINLQEYHFGGKRNKLAIPLPDEMAGGIYVVLVRLDNHASVRKMLVRH